VGRFCLVYGVNVSSIVGLVLGFVARRSIFFLHDKGKVRCADLTTLIANRGTRSLNLKELNEEELIRRRIVTSKPIEAHYSSTDKGKEIMTHLDKKKINHAYHEMESKTKTFGFLLCACSSFSS
jgi:DNA-binding HxlR family transcriptional regulator